MMRNESGFTLLELLLSLALVGVLAGLSLPVSEAWLQRNDVALAETEIGQSLRRAQLLAQAVAGDASWGVSIDSADNNLIVLFQGDDYAGRDATYDEAFDLPTTITVSGVGEVVFDRMTGLPQSTGTITLTTDDGDARNVTINAKGTVSY